MKKVILAILIVLPIFLMAQSEGVIQFEEQISFEIDLPEEMKEMAANIPNSQKVKTVLTFNETASIYENAKNDAAPQELNMGSEDGGMQIQMKFDIPENKTFTNIEEEKIIEKQEFMGKKFLITGTAKKYKWKLTGEQETILDYTCQKAIFKDSTHNFIAWFTPQIPVATGPSGMSGLPGMILKLDSNDGQRVTVATAVELKEIDKKAIKAPKKGKKVTRDEYEKIVAEKMKEMEAEFGHGSGTRVIIQN